MQSSRQRALAGPHNAKYGPLFNGGVKQALVSVRAWRRAAVRLETMAFAPACRAYHLVEIRPR